MHILLTVSTSRTKKGQKDSNQTIAPSDKGNSKGQYPAIWVKPQYGKQML